MIALAMERQQKVARPPAVTPLRQKIAPFVVRMILRLRAAGMSYRQITRETGGVSSRTISKILKRAVAK